MNEKITLISKMCRVLNSTDCDAWHSSTYAYHTRWISVNLRKGQVSLKSPAACLYHTKPCSPFAADNVRKKQSKFEFYGHTGNWTQHPPQTPNSSMINFNLSRSIVASYKISTTGVVDSMARVTTCQDSLRRTPYYQLHSQVV